MRKLNQNYAMAFLGLVVVIIYYMLLQQDVISSTEVVTYNCLNDPTANPQLCIMCIKRSELNIANQSSIYITDNVNKFKVMTIPSEDYFTCEQLLQFVSYELPMQNSNDIKFEKLGATKQIIELLDIQISEEAINKFQIESQRQSIAVFLLKQKGQLQTTLITYSSLDGQDQARYFGQIISECSMVLAIFCVFYFGIKQRQIRCSCIACIFISFMILSQTMLSNTNYLINYAISLTIGFYFATSSMSRFVTIIVIALQIVSYMFNFQQQAIVVIFLAYLILSSNNTSKKVNTFVECCIALLFVCTAFRKHHHWLSLPLRKVIEYTILTLSPLLMIIIKNNKEQQKYERLSNGKPQNLGQASGVSLPGFDQADSGDQQN